MARVYIASQQLKASPTFAVSHPDLATPTFVTFVSPPYSSHLAFMPVRFKATRSMCLTHIEKLNPYLAGLHCILEHCSISSSADQ
eukprot:9986466-Karenia_brevis.AAC.1